MHFLVDNSIVYPCICLEIWFRCEEERKDDSQDIYLDICAGGQAKATEKQSRTAPLNKKTKQIPLTNLIENVCGNAHADTF